MAFDHLLQLDLYKISDSNKYSDLEKKTINFFAFFPILYNFKKSQLQDVLIIKTII